jgi:hypothetical protein
MVHLESKLKDIVRTDGKGEGELGENSRFGNSSIPGKYFSFESELGNRKILCSTSRSISNLIKDFFKSFLKFFSFSSSSKKSKDSENVIEQEDTKTQRKNSKSNSFLEKFKAENLENLKRENFNENSFFQKLFTQNTAAYAAIIHICCESVRKIC